MASKLNGGLHNGTSNGHAGLIASDSTEEEILGLGDYSSRLERVLLALMRQQDTLQKAMQTEKCEREKNEKELKDKLDNNGMHFEDMLKRERGEREKMNQKLEGELNEKLDSGNSDLEELRARLDEERRKREESKSSPGLN